MPVPIGAFISANVYNNRLKSEHDIKTPSSCRFVNVANGKEEKKGHSWMVTILKHRAIDVTDYLSKRMFERYRSPLVWQRSSMQRESPTESLHHMMHNDLSWRMH